MESEILKIYNIIHSTPTIMVVLLACLAGLPLALFFCLYQAANLLFTYRQMKEEEERINRKHLKKVI